MRREAKGSQRMSELDWPELDWTEEGPRSTRFDDVYFQLSDGLAESRAVFLAGCGLPERFAGRRAFHVGELGFGTGLNILALLDLWRRHRPDPQARLNIVSVEGYLISAADAARALAAFPELAEPAADLLAQWPDGRQGRHVIDFPEFGATLILCLGEVGAVLDDLDARMDAWFLDGFAPARNPQMWTEAVLSRVAALSAPGCMASSFTVAGGVRRRLAAEGFAVAKRPGFGRKRERLEAVMPGVRPAVPALRIAVIGAGIGGACLVRAFRRAGHAVALFEAEGSGAGASGNPAALVTPRLDAGLGEVAVLHAEAFARAIQIYRTEALAALIARGALQLEKGPRDPARFDAISAWDGFAPGALQRLSPRDATRLAGELPAVGVLRYRDALVLEPATVLAAFLGDVTSERRRVARIARSAARWSLTDAKGAGLGDFDAVCVAAGFDTASLVADTALRPVRGQVTTSARKLDGEAVAWGGYVIPTRRGLLFGATHQRGDADHRARSGDDADNLESLATVRPALARRVGLAPLGHRAAIRTSTPDHMPLAGEAVPGLFLLTGFGGRGFTLAPLLAEEVAARVTGAPRPLSRSLARRLDPRRYTEALPGSEGSLP
jgi:tRNA 5-methylaminomethyl-2-thiouridine biosynthesis bifunctional protein